MKYFILLWTNVLFCRILTGKTKLLTKSNSKPNMFLFLFRKTWTDKQTKKKKRNCPLEGQKKLHNGEIKVNEIFYSSLNKCSILSDSQRENKSYSLKATQNLTCFFFLFRKTWTDKQTKKKKRNAHWKNKKNSKRWNQGQWNILFFSEQMFYFVGFSVGKQQLLTKSNSKPNVFLFFCFEKLEQHKQTKKKETKCSLEGQKNSKMVKSGSMKYFILLWNKCSILSDSHWENKSYSLKGNSKPNMFLFLFRKTWTDKQTKKRNEMLTRRTKKTPKWWNQGQWNILFFSEQMFYFVGFSDWEKKITH